MCIAERSLEWQEYQDPPLAPGHLRIRAEYAAPKHGTEMSLFRGSVAKRGRYDGERQVWVRDGEGGWGGFPFAVGNMIVGRVAEAGPGATGWHPGDRVCCYSGFQETCTVDAGDAWRMPEEMPWQSAVCLDPAVFACGAVRDGHVRIGDAVAVFGLGAIGLMVVQFARLSGADPILALDPLDNRRKVAAELGASLTLDPFACDAGLEIREATGGRGVDVAVDYSGDVRALQQALRGVAYGGTVVLGAMPPPYASGLDLGVEGHFNVPKIVFSRACSQPDREAPRWDLGRVYDFCWRLLVEGQIRGKPIVQPVVPFADLLEEYPRIDTHPEMNVKLGVAFWAGETAGSGQASTVNSGQRCVRTRRIQRGER